MADASRKAKKHSEAMIKILFRIIERTSAGGATQDELRETYLQVKGAEPHDRTLKRIINDINAYFNEWEEEGDLCLASSPSTARVSGRDYTPVILSFRKQNTRRYIFSREFGTSSRQEELQGAMIALKLYPQQKAMIDDQFQMLMRIIGEQVFAKKSKWIQMQEEMRQYVLVSGYSNSLDFQVGRLMIRILEAIRRKKRVQFDYIRNYDGVLTKARTFDCYGIVYRLGVWYLVGKDQSSRDLRVFRIDQIDKFTVIENSLYEIPSDFSLKETFQDSWGVWIGEGAERLEKVRLLVQPGMSQKFVNTKFHDSQTIKIDDDGSAVVEFKVTGARQMLPWLMTWADTVEVDEPVWLRDVLLETARSTVNMYTNIR